MTAETLRLSSPDGRLCSCERVCQNEKCYESTLKASHAVKVFEKEFEMSENENATQQGHEALENSDRCAADGCLNGIPLRDEKKRRIVCRDVSSPLPLEIWILITTAVIQHTRWIQPLASLWKTNRSFQKIIKNLAAEFVNSNVATYINALPLSQDRIDTLRDQLYYYAIFRRHIWYRVTCAVELRETCSDEESVKKCPDRRIQLVILSSHVKDDVSVHSPSETRGRALAFITPGLLDREHSILGSDGMILLGRKPFDDKK